MLDSAQNRLVCRVHRQGGLDLDLDQRLERPAPDSRWAARAGGAAASSALLRRAASPRSPPRPTDAAPAWSPRRPAHRAGQRRRLSRESCRPAGRENCMIRGPKYQAHSQLPTTGMTGADPRRSANSRAADAGPGAADATSCRRACAVHDQKQRDLRCQQCTAQSRRVGAAPRRRTLRSTRTHDGCSTRMCADGAFDPQLWQASGRRCRCC